MGSAILGSRRPSRPAPWRRWKECCKRSIAQPITPPPHPPSVKPPLTPPTPPVLSLLPAVRNTVKDQLFNHPPSIRHLPSLPRPLPLHLPTVRNTVKDALLTQPPSICHPPLPPRPSTAAGLPQSSSCGDIMSLYSFPSVHSPPPPPSFTPILFSLIRQ